MLGFPSVVGLLVAGNPLWLVGFALLLQCLLRPFRPVFVYRGKVAPSGLEPLLLSSWSLMGLWRPAACKRACCPPPTPRPRPSSCFSPTQLLTGRKRKRAAQSLPHAGGGCADSDDAADGWDEYDEEGFIGGAAESWDPDDFGPHDAASAEAYYALPSLGDSVITEAVINLSLVVDFVAFTRLTACTPDGEPSLVVALDLFGCTARPPPPMALVAAGQQDTAARHMRPMPWWALCRDGAP